MKENVVTIQKYLEDKEYYSLTPEDPENMKRLMRMYNDLKRRKIDGNRRANKQQFFPDR